MDRPPPVFLVLEEDFKNDGEMVFRMLAHIAKERKSSVKLCVSLNNQNLTVVEKYEIHQDCLKCEKRPLSTMHGPRVIANTPDQGYLPLKLQAKQEEENDKGEFMETWIDVFTPMEEMACYQSMNPIVRKSVI